MVAPRVTLPPAKRRGGSASVFARAGVGGLQSDSEFPLPPTPHPSPPLRGGRGSGETASLSKHLQRNPTRGCPPPPASRARPSPASPASAHRARRRGRARR